MKFTFPAVNSAHHRPSDDTWLADAAGAVRIVQLIAATAGELADRKAASTLIE